MKPLGLWKMAEVTEALVGAGGTGPVARRTGGKQHQFYKERGKRREAREIARVYVLGRKRTATSRGEASEKCNPLILLLSERKRTISIRLSLLFFFFSFFAISPTHFFFSVWGGADPSLQWSALSEEREERKEKNCGKMIKRLKKAAEKRGSKRDMQKNGPSHERKRDVKI